MKFNNIILFFLVIILSGCNQYNVDKNQKVKSIFQKKYKNSGFALIYNDDLNIKKLDNRSLQIFSNNLKKKSFVKITNPVNNKSLVAEVKSNRIKYSNFYNSVISNRIAEILELDEKEPFIEIILISKDSTFIAKKAKTFEEEKKVADKAPVDSISVNDLNRTDEKKIKKKINNEFKYVIKIADFYYLNTAKQMVKRIKSELNIKKTDINKISENKFRVFTGPYLSLKALQKAYNSIETLGFENIELIKYD